jgi:hypothetical protein
MSLLVTGWTGGALQVFLDFIPNAYAYFLVVLHCNSKRKLQILALMIFSVCLFDIVQGYYELQDAPVATASSLEIPDKPYLLSQRADSGGMIYRVRGQNFLADPNDLAQLMVCCIPLMFFFWRPKKIILNTLLVLLPVSALLYGDFLTHSRGSVLALLAMTVVAARRRIKTIPALLLAGVLFSGAMAMHFTGGRDISVDNGEDRMDLWGEGLDLVKAHPVFGIGYNQMPDHTAEHLTAHNTIVVCVAELGLFGLYFWSLFMLPTIRDVSVIASANKVGEAIELPAVAKFPRELKKSVVIDKPEINRLGRLMVLSFTGFLVAAWFLSRAYTMTLFLLGGIAEVLFQMALQQGMIGPRMALPRQLKYCVGLTFALVALVYVGLRIGNIMR